MSFRNSNLKWTKKKHKILSVGKKKMRYNIDLKIGNTKFQTVKQFCYLRSTINNENCCSTEIERRIALGKQAFQKKKNILGM